MLTVVARQLGGLTVQTLTATPTAAAGGQVR
jgi:hypothetical protein